MTNSLYHIFSIWPTRQWSRRDAMALNNVPVRPGKALCIDRTPIVWADLSRTRRYNILGFKRPRVMSTLWLKVVRPIRKHITFTQGVYKKNSRSGIRLCVIRLYFDHYIWQINWSKTSAQVLAVHMYRMLRLDFFLSLAVIWQNYSLVTSSGAFVYGGCWALKRYRHHETDCRLTV